MCIKLAKELLSGFTNNAKVLIFTKSHLEVQQILNFAEEIELYSIAPLLGREFLCPFKCKSSRDCYITRLRNECKAIRKNVQELKNINLEKLKDLYFKYRICPYEYLYAKCNQVNVIVTTYSYLANFELYKQILNLIRHPRFVMTVFDEFHNIVLGLEKSIEFNLEVLREWACRGNKFAKLILNKLQEKKNEEVIRLSDSEVLHFYSTKPEIFDLVSEIENYLFTDLNCILIEKNNKITLRSLIYSTILHIMNRSSKVIGLTASFSRRFLDFFKPYTRFSEIEYVETPCEVNHFKNLDIIILYGIEFTEDVRFQEYTVNVIESVINKFVTRNYILGGLIIIFPCKKYLKYIYSKIKVNHVLKTFVLTSNENSFKVFQEFKENARRFRTVLLTYAGNPLMEGLNFIDEELIGVLIIGFPFPEFNRWTELKKIHYENVLKIPGFKSTYLYPAISVTAQIIGRLTRSLERLKKRCILFDSRFYKFRKYFPNWIKISKYIHYQTYLSKDV